MRLEEEKRGKLLSPRTVLAVDRSAGPVTVPGSNGKMITAATGDVRHATFHELAATVFDSIDLLSEAIDDVVSREEETAESEPGQQHITPNQDDEFTTDDGMNMPLVGAHLEVYWLLDAHFFPGTISCIDADVQPAIT